MILGVIGLAAIGVSYWLFDIYAVTSAFLFGATGVIMFNDKKYMLIWLLFEIFLAGCLVCVVYLTQIDNLIIMELILPCIGAILATTGVIRLLVCIRKK